MWLACVGDDPAPGPGATNADGGVPMGDRLGPCFPDGKCKEGLVCRDGAVCLRPEEPPPTPDGGAPADSGGDAASDAGNLACPVRAPDLTKRPPCIGAPSGCGADQVCCPDGCGAPESCTGARLCDTRQHCPQDGTVANACCLAAVQAPVSCTGQPVPTYRTATTAGSTCVSEVGANPCGNDAVRPCQIDPNKPDGECPDGQRCLPALLEHAGTWTTIGTCQ